MAHGFACLAYILGYLFCNNCLWTKNCTELKFQQSTMSSILCVYNIPSRLCPYWLYGNPYKSETHFSTKIQDAAPHSLKVKKPFLLNIHPFYFFFFFFLIFLPLLAYEDDLFKFTVRKCI